MCVIYCIDERLMHNNVSFQILVDSMHERKIEMAKRVSGFIGLPGGFGTFEEVREYRPR